jgi:hypothetical protein
MHFIDVQANIGTLSFAVMRAKGLSRFVEVCMEASLAAVNSATITTWIRQ